MVVGDVRERAGTGSGSAVLEADEDEEGEVWDDDRLSHKPLAW